MAGGRPTTYSKTKLRLANEYIDDYASCGDVAPTCAGLACELKVAERTLYGWGEKHPEFMQTLKRLQAKQKRVLENQGLNGNFNPTIAKLMLANHGYTEKTQTELVGDDERPLSVNQHVSISFKE